VAVVHGRVRAVATDDAPASLAPSAGTKLLPVLNGGFTGG
jgi:hypothetical protein